MSVQTIITKNKIIEIANDARRKFESGEVDRELLTRLYNSYNSVDNIESLLEKANMLFPRLNCGLATLYLREVFGDGEIVRGRYKSQHHTFLLINSDIVVDITADQYGGPKVYVGPLREPWQTKSLFSQSKSLSQKNQRNTC